MPWRTLRVADVHILIWLLASAQEGKNTGYSDQQSGKIELEFMTEYTMGKLRAIEVHKMKS